MGGREVPFDEAAWGTPRATVVAVEGELTEDQLAAVRAYADLIRREPSQMGLQPFQMGLPVLSDGNGEVRQFETGATRDTEDGKLDFEAFLSPLVLLRYAEYMHKHRKQSDGQLRDGDNWQKGIPSNVYMKSLMRHLMDVWLLHHGHSDAARGDMQEALCGVIFNAMGYLFNELGGLE